MPRARSSSARRSSPTGACLPSQRSASPPCGCCAGGGGGLVRSAWWLEPSPGTGPPTPCRCGKARRTCAGSCVPRTTSPWSDATDPASRHRPPRSGRPTASRPVRPGARRFAAWPHAMTEARLLTERNGRVLIVRLTNPPRTFFDEQMGIELRALVREVEKDSSLGAVILTGKDLFVTHYNVPDLVRATRSAPFPVSHRLGRGLSAYARQLERAGWLWPALRKTPMREAINAARLYRTFARMNASHKVFIAAMNGLALGMGTVLALACDLRLMADGEDAGVGLIETGISMLAGAGGTQRVTRMVGQSRAAELLLDGRWFSPHEAAAIGLVHRVVDADDLDDEALALAHRLAGRSPVVNRELKRMVYDAGTRPFARAMRMEAASLIATMATARATEDMETYLGELAEHDPPSDRDVLDAWEKMLATGPAAADVPCELP